MRLSPLGRDKKANAKARAKIEKANKRVPLHRRDQITKRGRTHLNGRIIDTCKEFMGCEDCGVRVPSWALDAHHRDPKEKKFSVSKGGSEATSAAILELLKCDVLCVMCHRRHHLTKIRQPGSLKKWIAIQKRGGRLKAWNVT